MEKLRERWGLKSNWGILAILVAFSINGTFAARVVRPLLKVIGINKDNLNTVLFWVLYVIIMFAVYQFTLPFSGWLVGQYKFFKNMQTKMLIRIKLKKA